MKAVYIMILLIGIVGCASADKQVADSGPYTGEISVANLLSNYSHFQKEFANYRPSPAELASVNKLEGKSLLILFGTWCHDSEREVPRLLKLLDVSGVKLASLSLYGVNYNKQEPNGLHRQYALQYSPTIVLLDDDNELGRIVEKPQKSLGEDLGQFLSQ